MKKIFFITLILSFIIVLKPALAAVTVVNTGQENKGTSLTSITISSFAATGADFIYLGVSQWSATDRTPSATFNGSQNFVVHAQQTVADGSGTRRVTILKLVAPNQTTANIVVSWGGTVDEAVAGATAWVGVDQTTPLGTAVASTSPGNISSTTIRVTASVGSVIHDTYSGSADSQLNASSNQTQRWLDWAAANTTEGGGATAAGTGSPTTMTWQNIGFGGALSVIRIVQIGVPINAGSTAPTVTTGGVTSIGATTAVGQGNVTSDGGSSITERGIVWNTTGTPTTSDNKATAAGTTGAYSANITSLVRGTTYHVRAYAINSLGTSYGNEVTFHPGSVMNIDVSLYGPSTLYSGLAAWWTFDGKKLINGILDSTGKAAHTANFYGGTISTSSILSPGKIGQAATFNGVTYAYLPSTDASFESNDGSITGWVKTTDDNDDEFILFGGTGQYSVEMGTNATGSCTNELISIFTTARSICYTTANRKELFDGKWHFIAITEDTSAHLYLDGVAKTFTLASGADTGPFTSAVGLNTVFIGAWATGAGFPASGNFLKGSEDDVRVYTRALSQQEVTELYNTTGGGMISTTQVGPQGLNSGLVGWWTFDGKNMLTNVKDSSGSGFNGNLTGGATTTAPGKMGQALSLNATGKYVAIGTGPSTVNSVSFWMQAATSTNEQIMEFNGTQTVSSSGGTLSANGFGGTTVIYVDGAVSSTIDTNWHLVTITTTSSFNASAMNIGKISTGYYGGSLDDVRVYNRVLSPQEVTQLYIMGI